MKTFLPYMYCTLHVRDFERTANTLKRIILLQDLVFLWELATIWTIFPVLSFNVKHRPINCCAEAAQNHIGKYWILSRCAFSEIMVQLRIKGDVLARDVMFKGSIVGAPSIFLNLTPVSPGWWISCMQEGENPSRMFGKGMPVRKNLNLETWLCLCHSKHTNQMFYCQFSQLATPQDFIVVQEAHVIPWRAALRCSV